MIRCALMSPCHPRDQLIAKYDTDPPNRLRCAGCGRVWELGVCIPLNELLLYSTQNALEPLPPEPNEQG